MSHLALLFAMAAIDFSRDIRPLLSDRCFRCHGPDEAARMAGLRLDGPSAAIVPGDPAASKVFKRISTGTMPPAKSGVKPLAEREVALVRDWIAQGAKWQTHWAFEAPKRPPLTASKDARWRRNEVDTFVLARLEREGLRPSPEASREQLIRRVSLDLTGLPPSLAEIDAFAVDTSSTAYEKVVDRLLASQRYGERMAVDWLDAARYADTHGYQVDPEKQMWAWRDWVIGAFNRNLPFDRFTIEQIAGDLLPGATLEQRVATGFNRNHRVNTEAGSIAEEFHVENVIDRISTTGTVWLGLSVGCARCHDHKYDPITSKDFYGMFAFFNNVPEVGTGGPRDGKGNLQPVLKLPDADADAKLREVDAKIEKQRAMLKELDAGVEPSSVIPPPEWRVLTPSKVESENGVTLAVQSDGSILSSGAHPAKDIYTLVAETTLTGITAFRVELLPDPTLPGGASGRGPEGRSMLTQFDVKLNGRSVAMTRVTADFKSPESVLERVIRPQKQLPNGWAPNPEQTKPHYAVVEPRLMINGVGSKRFEIRLGNERGEGQLMGRFRVSVTDAEFPEPLDGKPLSKREYAVHTRLHRVAADALARLQDERTGIDNRIPSTMVMQELPESRDTFILARGAYDKPGAKVAASVPTFLPPLPAGADANRLGFAQWLVDSSNPLTARVTVNRFWQSYFGTGLVRTAEDFGSQGSAPTHPELLDWMATEFIRTGWDVKRMQKLIVMSATYRQSSRVAPTLAQRDPDNTLLARGPRFRLSGEAIRDQALRVSGLLTERVGGPSVKPYQPDGLWEQLSVIDDRKLYERSKGADLWRRSLYTFWKRTVPPPALTTFDAPTREFCVVKRPMSSTPLQALALLNDETYIEAARKLAERMIAEAPARPIDRIAHGFRLATGRRPSPAEVSVLAAGYDRRISIYGRDPKLAERLLAAGESPRAAGIDPVTLAAYTTVANVILNLDEVVTKQ